MSKTYVRRQILIEECTFEVEDGQDPETVDLEGINWGTILGLYTVNLPVDTEDLETTVIKFMEAKKLPSILAM